MPKCWPIFFAKRKILYYDNYGGFKLSKEGFLKIYERFPEKRKVYDWDEILNFDRIHHFVRYDQEINEFMLLEGLENFGKNLEMEEIPKICQYRISDYDGWETVHVVIPYKNIIKDLLSYVKSDKTNTEFSCDITKELLFGKGIDVLAELM